MTKLQSQFVLFDAIVELYVMDNKMSIDFLIRKWAYILRVIKAYLIHDLYFVYVVEAFITLNWKLNINTWVHFLAYH
jgi:hypothetical protein